MLSWDLFPTDGEISVAEGHCPESEYNLDPSAKGISRFASSLPRHKDSSARIDYPLLSIPVLAQAPAKPPAPKPDDRLKADILLVIAHPDDETGILT